MKNKVAQKHREADGSFILGRVDLDWGRTVTVTVLQNRLIPSISGSER